MSVMVFSFPYDVFGIFIEVKDVVKRVVMFIGCCLGRVSAVYI